MLQSDKTYTLIPLGTAVHSRSKLDFNALEVKIQPGLNRYIDLDLYPSKVDVDSS